MIGPQGFTTSRRCRRPAREALSIGPAGQAGLRNAPCLRCGDAAELRVGRDARGVGAADADLRPLVPP